MKVLQIIDSLPTGGARFLVNAVPAFNALGLKTDVLLLDGSETDFLKDLQQNSEGEIFSLTNGNRWDIRNVLRIIPYFENYDIIHVHMFPASYFVAVAKFISGSAVPVIFTEHNSQNRRAAHFLFKYVEKWVYRRFVKIVCLTSQVQNFVLRNLKVNKSNLPIIENGINLIDIRSALPAPREGFGYNADDILILMPARMEAQKDHETVIKVMNLLPDNYILILAGDGSKRAALESMGHDLAVNSRINFLGNRKDIFELMKMSDIIVLSSHFEGLSLAALEAMASGRPFVASNVEGLDFIKGAGLLFERGNVKELADVILSLMSDKELYRNTVTSCMKKADDYDVEKMVKNYIQLYESLYIK
ncbi:glycosyltransferase family 4 protein [Kaistella sp. DKR-2]|uniref:glycosyltransferase family 4 protein n=1 Tax=Kaistella soli TaxID=2849654 RepID=UPI001C273094|nr:glycosyltransferase family 4 protein [Kaistella soli]MBU8883061.1 glycosyltransferase family 4 protein [Kaistella soli]